MRRFFVTDIHGSYLGLKQVLDTVNYDYENDMLICGGDTCDGWSGVKEAFDLLMKCKNLKYIIGNHDMWYVDWFENKIHKEDFQIWQHHGGKVTLNQLGNTNDTYYNLLKYKSHKILRLDNYVFVHAGLDYTARLDEQTDYFCLWDRQYIKLCFKNENEKNLSHLMYAEQELGKYTIFFGHTPTEYLIKNNYTPMKMANAILCDTSSAFNGCVTLYNIDTHEYVQSEKSKILYPDELGRNKLSYNQSNK